MVENESEPQTGHRTIPFFFKTTSLCSITTCLFAEREDNSFSILLFLESNSISSERAFTFFSFSLISFLSTSKSDCVKPSISKAITDSPSWKIVSLKRDSLSNFLSFVSRVVIASVFLKNSAFTARRICSPFVSQ